MCISYTYHTHTLHYVVIYLVHCLVVSYIALNLLESQTPNQPLSLTLPDSLAEVHPLGNVYIHKLIATCML